MAHQTIALTTELKEPDAPSSKWRPAAEAPDVHMAREARHMLRIKQMNCRWGPLRTRRCLEMSAVGLEPTRSDLQWILIPPPEPLGQTDCCPWAQAVACP